ncbi:MAG: O-antigen ligase family protein [Ilumatobacter sp.]|uniref:O-antigen ligase family protein n=1 Tax=Ilumatobacter sp. TaxID=1967498 RepID=UPI00261612B5|nr:O-antigen ligase family protein [Ilumatobacter sp.]MDJ0768718.1 O-antigen ligase family protein [Ilumatobacter sp.]
MTTALTTTARPPERHRRSRAGRDVLRSNGLLLLTLSAVVSRFVLLSAALVAIGMLMVAPGLSSSFRFSWVRAASVVVAGWLLYGLAIGSLPSPGAVGRWVDFFTTEGRAILPLLVLAAASSLSSRAVIERTLWRTIVLLVVSAGLALVLDVLGSSWVGGFRLFHGFTSGHHVPGFLYGLGIVYILIRRPFATSLLHFGSLAVLGAAVVSSGSRASLVGLGAVGAYLMLRRASTGTTKRVLAVAAACILVLVVSPRFRDTVTSFGSTRITSNAGELFRSRDNVDIAAVATSGAEANVLKRFGLFGEALDDFVASPFIGRGIYRFNDLDTVPVGVERIVNVDVAGERVHSDLQAHNMLLQLLSETGLVGTLAFVSVYWLVWRSARGRRLDPDAAQLMLVARAAIVFSFGVGLTSAALLTAGLGILASVLIGLGASYHRLPYTPRDVSVT